VMQTNCLGFEDDIYKKKIWISLWIYL
jgi:hypothetical protein